MHNELTAIIERDEEWYIAYCPEVSGANGQGRTKEEARTNLIESILLIFQDVREDALRKMPADGLYETVVIE
jgi:predicted RNase H-like HicB family nuclease